MKNLLFICFLFLAGAVRGAITEYYVSLNGGTVGLGTSAGDPMSYVTFKDYMEAGGVLTATAGDRFNIIGTNVIARTTTTDTFVNGGTVTSPVIIRGYKTTIGDGYQGRTVSGTGPLNTNNMPLITFTTGFFSLTGNNIILETVIISGVRAGALVSVGTGVGVCIKSCRMENNNTGATAGVITTAQSPVNLFDCDFELLAASGGAQAVAQTAGNPRIIGCRITGKTAKGALFVGTFSLVNCTIYNSLTGVDITSVTSQYLIDHNTITGCSSNGITIANNTSVAALVSNNMITDNGGFGIDATAATNGVFLSNNRFRDNVMGAVTNATDWVTATSYSQVTTDTGGAETDYVAAGSQDYRLINASPASGAGIPFSDIGGLQSTNGPAGAGGGAYSFPFAQ